VVKVKCLRTLLTSSSTGFLYSFSQKQTAGDFSVPSRSYSGKSYYGKNQHKRAHVLGVQADFVLIYRVLSANSA